jgi:hypothetical protein
MTASENQSQLRNAITDGDLKTKVQHIWNMAEREIHPFQAGITAQDFLHSCRVEDNIWRLIRENSSKFSDIELFLLSASAALHDIGKIEIEADSSQLGQKKSEDHGEAAKRLLLTGEDFRKYHFDRKVEAEAVAKIVSVHSNGLLEKLPEDTFNIGSDRVFLRSLAAIFRLADMLDSDCRRWPYLAMLLKEMKFPVKIEAWVGRRSIGGWDKSIDGKTIFLQGSPESEEDRISTLAYIDSLNRALTAIHKKVLENCPVEYLQDNRTINGTLHFPYRFEYCEFDGSVKKNVLGLTSLYEEVACEYADKAAFVYASITLKGIGDFTDKKNVKLSNIFINANVSLSVDWAPSDSGGFNEKTLSWIKTNMPEYNVTQSLPSNELLHVPNLKRLVLLGGPGSGKSIVSQYLMLNRLELVKSDCQSSSKIEGIPFLVTIREFAFARSKKSELDIVNYITDQVCEFLVKQVPIGFVEFWLRRTNSFVVLDGLDEVILPEERKLIRDMISSFSTTYPETRILVTSRFVGYDEMPLNNNAFLHFVMNTFNNTQKEDFVRKWYTERETNLAERERAIGGFLEALKDDRVSEMASNPLLLTIMALVHSSEHDLPKQRAVLYRKCVEAFIVNREKAKELLSYNSREIWECHDFLGYWLQTKAENVQGLSILISSEELRQALIDFISKKKDPRKINSVFVGNKVDEFIDAARRRVGLMVEQGESKWGFGHKSFQEYFAARYISQTTSGIFEIWREIEEKVENPNWIEPIKLLAGICGDFSPKLLHDLIDKLKEEYDQIEDPEKKRLILAGEIAGEIDLDFSDQANIAKELVNQFIEVPDQIVLTNLKRVMNNFYHNPELWEYMTKILKERTQSFIQNPFYYSCTAFYRSYSTHLFGDTRIDRVIALL